MRTNPCLAALICISLPASASPKFENVSAQLEITHEYVGGWEHFVGGGLATFDCNDDLLPDLFIAGGENPATLLKNRSSDQLRFEPATPDTLAITGITGAFPIDIDSDGHTDLAILRVGQNLMMKGLGDCAFAPFDGLGIDGSDAWTTSFSATWEKGNALPTLAFGNYVDRDDPDGPFQACDTHELWRPVNGAYPSKTSLEPGFCALSMLFSDWGHTGRQDLRISNDRHYFVRGGEEQMWAMEPALRLMDESDGWVSHQLWGMGIASRDLSGDGRPEVMLTSMGDQRLQILDNGKNPTFRDAEFARGTAAHRPYIGDDGRPSTGWHAQFGDVDNDGRDDLFIAKGNVEQMPGSAMEDPNNLLMQSADGRFVEMGDQAGIATFARSRGASLTDLNLDGRLDLVVVNRRAPVEIYQNVTDAGNWLLLDIRQSNHNHNAIGAWITVRSNDQVWHREITSGGGHASGAIGLHHFGLGASETAQVQVTWPSGEMTEWIEPSVNKITQIRR